MTSLPKINRRAINTSVIGKVIGVAIACGTLAGCAGFGFGDSKGQLSQGDASSVSTLGNVEYYTYLLANELFSGVRASRQARYAVVGFVPVDSLQYEPNHQSPLMLLGHQLEQGMMTEATKRGFSTQEFKLSNDIIVSEQSDRVLTRDIERLSSIERVDYYITGTLVHQESGAVVNARIIDARSKGIVAAATRFFPAELFWQEERVTTRNGKLYRTEGMR